MQYRFTFFSVWRGTVEKKAIAGLPTREDRPGGLAGVGESGSQSGTSKRQG